MSAAVVAKREKQSHRLLGLLKEYTERLNTLSAQSQEVFQLRTAGKDHNRLLLTKLETLEQHLGHLAPAIGDLARHVSQLVEHGDMDDVTRLEFRLRLADLEQTLAATRRVVSAALFPVT